MNLSEVPKWVWWAGGGVILLALLLARKGGASGAPSVTLAPAMSDPNAEATTQTALTTRASVFASLANSVLGYESGVTQANRDIGVAGIQASSDVARAGIAQNIALGQSYYETVQTQLREQAMTDRTALEGATQVMVTRATQEGESARTFSNNATGLSIAGIQGDLGKYLADTSYKTSVNNDRTALSIQESMAGVMRQASTNAAVTSGLKTVCNGVVGFFTLGLGHC